MRILCSLELSREMKKKRIHFQGYILIFVGPKCFSLCRRLTLQNFFKLNFMTTLV